MDADERVARKVCMDKMASYYLSPDRLTEKYPLSGFIAKRFASFQRQSNTIFSTTWSIHHRKAQIHQCKLRKHCVDKKDVLALLLLVIQQSLSHTINTTGAHTYAKLDTHSIPEDHETQELTNFSGPFECPVCFNLVQITDSSSWKRHIFADLQPYVGQWQDPLPAFPISEPSSSRCNGYDS